MAPQRLSGLDLARFFAFFGMVIVNFQVVMFSGEDTARDFLNSALVFLEGKAAATFVVLAGVGVTLAYQRTTTKTFHTTMLKRAAFLMVIGLINMSIFEADIIHYYAVYFAIGMWLLSLSKRSLLAITLFIVFAFPVLMLLLDYDAGWNWSTLNYDGFWTYAGFFRNLFFNGWHPVIPWLAFFSFGIFLAKLDLANKQNAQRIVVVGISGMVVIPMLSEVLVGAMVPILGQDTATVFATSPIPPGPLYMLNGASTALCVIGACLLVPEKAYQSDLLKTLCHTGQQTLTLYFAHILIGMGIVEALGLVEKTSTTIALWAAIEFVAASILFTYLWRKNFKRGPIEALMRRTTG